MSTYWRDSPALAAIYSAVLPGHLYIHVPFCARRCSYCDFSIAVRRVVPVSDFLEGIRLELNGILHALPADRKSEWNLDTVYLGGGTPSRLGPDGIGRLLGLVTERSTRAPDAEITIEANPEDVTPEAVKGWVAAGINRVSLGAQSFDDGVLYWMHRTHDAAQIGEAVRIARAGGIENLSLDLIFALPPEVERSWERDLDSAIALGPDHISLYGLTVEPATPLHKWTISNRVSLVPEEQYAGEFLYAHERMTGEGFAHYEVSNFALPGRESRHNAAYWSGDAYLGVGPAAHSYDGGRRRWNIKPYVDWLHAARDGRPVIGGEESLDSESSASERIYLGLRTRNGYELGGSDRAAAERWANAGWAEIDGNLVRLNAEGWLRLDSLAAGLTGS